MSEFQRLVMAKLRTTEFSPCKEDGASGVVQVNIEIDENGDVVSSIGPRWSFGPMPDQSHPERSISTAAGGCYWDSQIQGILS